LIPENIDSSFVRRLSANGRFYYDARDEHPIYAPSVTTILDKTVPKGYGFHQWLRNYGHWSDFIKYAKAHRGTVVHILVEMLAKGETIDPPTITKVIQAQSNLLDAIVLGGWKEYELSVRRYLESFCAFYDEYDPIVLSLEEMLYHRDLPYAGTADAIFGMRINGTKKRVLVDFKTGAELEYHALQLTAYKKLWNKIHPDEKVTACAVLYLKEGYRNKPTFKFKIVKPQFSRWKLHLGLYLDKNSYDGVVKPKIKPQPRDTFNLIKGD
jgi:hypothetical protein|tara:strand:- start:1056 stop:1859 length:804 start_codon:yes stop_codon:yes gene_type:complete